MRKIFVGNLPSSTQEEEIRELFSQYGTVRAIKLASDVFTGKCKGFGFVEMEGHEAREAIARLNGKSFKGQSLKVNEERERSGSSRGRRRR